jgi:hypothetical protein
MNSKKIKVIIATILISLIVFSLGYSFIGSIRTGGIHYGGILVLLYYFIPATIVVLVYSLVIRNVKRFFQSNSKINDIILSIVISFVLVVFMFTFWSFYDFTTRNISDKFHEYWLIEFIRFSAPITYFTFSVPLLFRYFNKQQ